MWYNHSVHDCIREFNHRKVLALRRLGKRRELTMRKQMRRAVVSILLVVCMLALSGCGGQRMMMGTGGTAGTYYAFGGVLAQYMKNYTGYSVTAVSTAASKANIQSIGDGDYQMGVTQSDVMTYAWEGIADLAGKIVSIGAQGSGVYFNAVDVLEGAGLTVDDIKPQYQSFDDSKEALKDGQIDAAFIVAGAPTSAITELATTNGVFLVPIEGELRDKIMDICPYYAPLVIPADTYPGQPDPIETITIKATMVVDADLDDEVVYQLTAAIFDHAEEITAENAKGAELSVENATSGIAVPFHAGAAKYFAEHGVTVETAD